MIKNVIPTLKPIGGELIELVLENRQDVREYGLLDAARLVQFGGRWDAERVATDGEMMDPSELERAEVISGEETTAVFTALRQFYDVIVVDTSSRPDEHLLAALDIADAVLVVCTPEIASLKNAARFLALAHELGYGDEKLKLTINRLSSGGSIPLKDIESNLRHKMAFGLPSDGLPVIEALNAGEPVVLMRPSARIARQIHAVGSELIHQLGLSEEAPAPNKQDGAKKSPTMNMINKLTRRKAS